MIARRLRTAGRLTLDLLLPPLCLTCDSVVDAPGRFCAACFRATDFITEPCCDTCGAPFADPARAGRMCRECQADPPPWAQARAALRYDAQARAVVLPLKYGDRTEVAAALAPLLLRAGGALVAGCDVIVPVPLHRARMISRRFNQAALIAQALGRLADKPTVLDGLQRLRRTTALEQLSAQQRTVALHGAIAIRPARTATLAGQRVLLVDDVLTSGATARACTHALLAAGAASVSVLVAARVADPRRH